jgi:type II secretory pathway pseudopilin PulG
MTKPISTAEPIANCNRHRDAGTTMIEIIVAVVLMGLVLGAVVAAVQMSTRSSSIAFAASRVETVLLNAADRVNRADQRCEYEEIVDAAAIGEGWDPDAVTVTVELLVANAGDPSDWQPQVCPAAVEPFDVQRLTITATDPGGRITRTLTMVKSDVN